MAAKRRGPGNPRESEWYDTPKEKRRRPKATFTLPTETIDTIARLSEELGESKARVVEAAVEHFAKRSKK